MIITENITIDGREFIKKYSDGGFYIERDGARYSEAIDPAETLREYVETDIPIEPEPEDDAAQKAAAFDYLTGRSQADE